MLRQLKLRGSVGHKKLLIFENDACCMGNHAFLQHLVKYQLYMCLEILFYNVSIRQSVLYWSKNLLCFACTSIMTLTLYGTIDCFNITQSLFMINLWKSLEILHICDQILSFRQSSSARCKWASDLASSFAIFANVDFFGSLSTSLPTRSRTAWYTALHFKYIVAQKFMQHSLILWS